MLRGIDPMFLFLFSLKVLGFLINSGRLSKDGILKALEREEGY
jgi:hypothetical protein